MAILHFRSIERRRTVRSSLAMNVLAYGETESGEKFKFWTKTTSVAAHGGVIRMDEKLKVGQVLQMLNECNMKKAVEIIFGAWPFRRRERSRCGDLCRSRRRAGRIKAV